MNKPLSHVGEGVYAQEGDDHKLLLTTGLESINLTEDSLSRIWNYMHDTQSHLGCTPFYRALSNIIHDAIAELVIAGKTESADRLRVRLMDAHSTYGIEP
jgi:hypothetical protein